MPCDVTIKPREVVTPPIYVGAVLENCSCEETSTTTTTTVGV